MAHPKHALRAAEGGGVQHAHNVCVCRCACNCVCFATITVNLQIQFSWAAFITRGPRVYVSRGSVGFIAGSLKHGKALAAQKRLFGYFRYSPHRARESIPSP